MGESYSDEKVKQAVENLTEIYLAKISAIATDSFENEGKTTTELHALRWAALQYLEERQKVFIVRVGDVEIYEMMKNKKPGEIVMIDYETSEKLNQSNGEKNK